MKEYIDLEMSPEALSHLLTMAGLEVEEVCPVGQNLDGIVAARILTMKPHAEANLSVCQVDTGTGTAQVVCGAPNLEMGMLVPFAPTGVTLPNGITIRERKIRGVHSQGVLLAEDEMGLTDDHTGIMILPPNLEPGTPLSASSGVLHPFCLSDWMFDLSITPNRPDWASVMGVAREISAMTGLQLKRPGINVETGGTLITDLTSVTIEDISGCPRYAAGVIQNVDLGPSPFWMRYRLFISGFRSINNIVDTTNYVLMEMGQPLHAFDYNRLRENRIVVRRAADGETFTTLDGENRILDNESLVICDAERPVALAGIMGGLNSEIFAGTTDILLESAYFDPVSIRRCSKRLGLSTEASYRFERGADIEGVPVALKRALSLISRLAGGTVASDIIDRYPEKYVPPTVRLRIDKTNRVLGTAISRDRMGGYLRALEMDVRDGDDSALTVIPPSYRVDITREADLVEEVARLFGYENIPVTRPRIRWGRMGNSPDIELRDRISGILVGLGLTEIITYSFVSPDSADMLGCGAGSPLRSFVEILNPLTVDQSVMRTSLVPGLLTAVRNNLSHEEKGLKFFEWGKVFFQKEAGRQPDEKISVAGVMAGTYRAKAWYCEERPVDFFDIKGAVETLLKGLGLEQVEFRKDAEREGYDAAVSCRILSAGSLLGQAGRVSSEAMRAWDMDRQDAYVFELDVAALAGCVPGTRRFRPFSRFPAVYRDISLLVDRGIESGGIMDLIREKGGDLVESVQLFDLYEGDKVAPGEKALAFRICYRSKHGTLDGETVNRLHESIIERIRKQTGGRLREG